MLRGDPSLAETGNGYYLEATHPVTLYASQGKRMLEITYDSVVQKKMRFLVRHVVTVAIKSALCYLYFLTSIELIGQKVYSQSIHQD